jgi:hypothetical protein
MKSSTKHSCQRPESGEPRESRLDSPLRLDPDLLQRLDQECRATDFTRNKWITALIQARLRGASAFGRSDRISLSGIAKSLRKIEARICESSHALAEVERVAVSIKQQRDEMERFRGQVRDMAEALDQAFKGNDSYWRGLIDDGARGSTIRPLADNRRRQAPR